MFNFKTLTKSLALLTLGTISVSAMADNLYHFYPNTITLKCASKTQPCVSNGWSHTSNLKLIKLSKQANIIAIDTQNTLNEARVTLKPGQVVVFKFKYARGGTSPLYKHAMYYSKKLDQSIPGYSLNLTYVKANNDGKWKNHESCYSNDSLDCPFVEGKL